MEIAKYGNYQQYKQELDTELRKTTEGFVKIGYLLKVAMDTDILKESGYANVYEFAQAEYNIDKSQVSRFININDRFSEGGYSDRLKEEFQGFGHAKLTIMLQLPDEINAELTPDFSKSEIQAIKEEYDEEKKVSDLEVLMEGEAPEQSVIENNLHKALHQMGKDEPELYVNLHKVLREKTGVQSVPLIKEILAPNAERMFSIRIQGVGRLILSVKTAETTVSLINMRSSEKETFPWEEVIVCLNKLMAAGMAPEASWSALYGEEFPKKAEVAPVQPVSGKATPKKEQPKKETKVQKAKKPEPKKPTPKAPESTEQDEQLLGQDNIMNHPEYLPEEMQKSPEIQNAEGISEEKEPENVTKDAEIVEKTPLEEAETPINPPCEVVLEETPAAVMEEDNLDPDIKKTIAGYKAGITSSISRLENLAISGRWESLINTAKDIQWRAEQILKLQEEHYV